MSDPVEAILAVECPDGHGDAGQCCWSMPDEPDVFCASRIRAALSPEAPKPKCGNCEGEPHGGPCCSVIRSDGKRCGCTGIGSERGGYECDCQENDSAGGRDT